MDYIENTFWIKRKILLKNYFDSLAPTRSLVSSLGISLRHSGYFAMIPSTFNIDTHLAEYPVLDYMFVKDNTNHIRSVGRYGSIKSSAYFDTDRLIYIIGLISSIPATNKDSISEDGFVSINSTLIRNAFKDYLSYLDYLIRTEVLCTDGQYIQGIKSKGYKFTRKYEMDQFVRYNYPEFRQPVEAIPSEIYSEEDGKFTLNTVEEYPYLKHWYTTKKLKIKENDAKRYAYESMVKKLSKGKNAWDINRDKSDGKITIRKHPQTQYHAAMHNISSIAIGDYKVSIDTNVHRLHSVITNLQKSYRAFLHYDNIPLVNIDISNSQPYLLCLLLNPYFWHKESNIPLNIGMLQQNIQNKFSVELLNKIRRYVDELSSTKDNSTEDYIDMISQGRIYEYMMEIINKNTPLNLQRDDIKVMILITLFSKNRYMPIYKKYFRNFFHQIYDLIELIKSEDHTTLACLLQNIESEIILHRCCPKIWDEGKHQIPVFTIHDSISTTRGNEKFVKEIMQNVLFENIRIAPNIKIETIDI